MIHTLFKKITVGSNYLIEVSEPDLLDNILIGDLHYPHIGGVQNDYLWGKKGKWLSLIGQKLGWVPNQLPVTFFAETVLEEIAHSFVNSQNKLESSEIELNNARILLEQLQIAHLAGQNPFFLSAGESRLVWFLTQWAKQPSILVSGYLPTNLSPGRLLNLLNFIIHSEEMADRVRIKPSNFILGYLASQLDWIDLITSSRINWKKIQIADFFNID
jgi:hypothetical protein